MQNYHFSKLIGLFLIILVSFSGYSQIKNEFGQTFKPNTLTKSSIVIFFSTECPICEKYTKTINQIDSLTEIPIYLIIIDKTLKLDDIQAYKRKFDQKQVYFFDYKQRLVKKLGATVTPEVFFFDNDGHIIYSGAIDDWFFELGKAKTKPSENYLLDAIESINANLPIKFTKTKPIGCYLN